MIAKVVVCCAFIAVATATSLRPPCKYATDCQSGEFCSLEYGPEFGYCRKDTYPREAPNVYDVKVFFAGGFEKVTGKLVAHLHSDARRSDGHIFSMNTTKELSERYEDFEPNTEMSYVVETEFFNKFDRISLEWDHFVGFCNPPPMHSPTVDKVHIVHRNMKTHLPAHPHGDRTFCAATRPAEMYSGSIVQFFTAC